MWKGRFNRLHVCSIPSRRQVCCPKPTFPLPCDSITWLKCSNLHRKRSRNRTSLLEMTRLHEYAPSEGRTQSCMHLYYDINSETESGHVLTWGEQTRPGLNQITSPEMLENIIVLQRKNTRELCVNTQHFSSTIYLKSKVCFLSKYSKRPNTEAAC